MAFDDFPRVHVHLTRNINLGDYESMKVSVSLTHVPFDADADLIKQMTDRSEFVFEEMSSQMEQMVTETRENMKKERLRIMQLRNDDD